MISRVTAPSRFPPRAPVLPPDVQRRVQDELQPGERLVWAEQPDPRAFARGAWVISLFGIPFTGFAVFWICMAGGMLWFGNRSPVQEGGWMTLLGCLPLWGVPVLAIGLGMIGAPLWMRRAARRTVYALTDRRAIVWRARPVRREIEVRSFQPAELGELTRVERDDGTGDLVFRELVSTSYDSDGDRRTTRTRIGFIGIDRVREVEDLLRKTLIREPTGQDLPGHR